MAGDPIVVKMANHYLIIFYTTNKDKNIWKIIGPRTLFVGGFSLLVLMLSMYTTNNLVPPITDK